VKKERAKEEHHFESEGFAGEALHGLRQEEHGPRGQYHNDVPEYPWREIPRKLRNGLTPHYKAEEAQVENHNRSQQQRKREEMERLDDRKVYARIAYYVSQPRVVAPLKKRQQGIKERKKGRHYYLTSLE
jgi:hypothetical protein